MDNKTLETILTTYGPTGHEERIGAVLQELVAPYADEVYNDKLGNLIAVKRGASGKKIMLSAHMDQIGLVVVAIDEKGFDPNFLIFAGLVLAAFVVGEIAIFTPKTRKTKA